MSQVIRLKVMHLFLPELFELTGTRLLIDLVFCGHSVHDAVVTEDLVDI